MIKFGTGGWRAIIGDQFTRANIQLLTAAVVRTLKQKGETEKGFLIGYDRRFLSEMAASWAAEVVAGEGVKCSIINRESPTPLIMYALNLYGMSLGMAITASHNPAVYNGIKVFIKGGRDADEALTSEIENIISGILPEEIKILSYESGLASGMIEMIDPMNAYIDNILDAVDVDAIRESGLHVVIDPMFGVSTTALQTILLSARCNVDVIHERHDTLFGGRLPAPSEETLAPLITHVWEKHCDIGLATDGDADRLGVIDDRAKFLHPNKILVLLYYYLLKYKGWSGPAVRSIATTHMLDKIAADFGECCYEVPVGFKYISAKMAETGAIIGGESSGGLTVRGHIQGKDGIYAATLLVEMLAKCGCKLSFLWKELEKRYGRYEMMEHDYHFSEDKKVEISSLLFVERELPQFELPYMQVSYMDGCKVYFKNGGWLIVRFSGTEPLIRIFCEMPDKDLAEKICGEMERFLGCKGL